MPDLKTGETMSILLLEDNPLDADLITHAMRKEGLNFNYDVASNEQEFLTALEKHYDVILADYNLPQYNAHDALQCLKKKNLDIPFIIVSGSIGEELAVEIMRQGATDYLLKDRLGRLGAAVTKAYENILEKTSREQLEEAYQVSEKRYRSMFHNNHTVMLFLDPESGAIIDANPAAEKFYGKTRAQMLKLTLQEIDTTTEKDLNQKLRGSTSWQNTGFQSTHIGANNQVHIVEINSCLIPEEDRSLLFVIIRDVTQRKSMESLINNVFQSMGEALMVINNEFKVIAANRAYCELSGQPLEEIIGKKCCCAPNSTIRPCQEDDFECPSKEALMTGLPKSKNLSLQGPHGQMSYFDIRAFPMTGDTGDVISTIMVFNDITEERRLEAQLRQSQKMEAIGTLTGGIAHDFNNILTAIIGNVSLMGMKMQETDPLVRFVDNIKDATERATALTKGLLAFSRKQVLNPVAVNLNQTILGMDQLLRRVISEEIDLCTDLFPQDITVLADQSQLEQVIMNLVVNGRDAMEDGGRISIKTELAWIDDDFIYKHGFGKRGQYAQVIIKDNGPGMDQETLNRIYEPFFTTKDVGKGTGLGLSTAYGIIKQHSGFIACESEPGKGTEFQLFFPLSEVENHKTSVAKLKYEGGTESILLVEDDPNVRMMLKEVLQEAGYGIEVAANGTEAIEKFTALNRDIQLLILDVIMPVMNGKEVFIELEKLKPGIKAIFISGYTDDIIHKKGIMEEHIHFLAKPLSPRALLSKVREVLDTPRDRSD